MDLFKLHTDPESLVFFEEVDLIYPELFWKKYQFVPKELKKRESAIATSAEYSYKYAMNVLGRKQFKLGEKAIATSAEYSFLYAQDILNGPFSLGEKVISTDFDYAYSYVTLVTKAPFKYDEVFTDTAKHAMDYVLFVLKRPFPKGEAVIATDSAIAMFYTNMFLKKDFYVDGKLIVKYT